MSDFGSRLKQVRKSRGITQIQLAEGLGVAQSTIANYESNLRFPGESALWEIADHLSISIDYLMGREPSDNIADMETGLFDENLSDVRSRFLSHLMMGHEENAVREVYRQLRGSQGSGSIAGVFDEVLAPTLKRVGELWESGELEVAQEHYISDIVDRLISTVIQGLQTAAVKPFKALFLLPGGEEHHLGLKMSAACFKSKGWETIYLGRSLPVSSLERFMKAGPVDILVLSVTLREHLNSCEHLIKVIKGFPEAYRPKVLVGGRAVVDSDQATRLLDADYYVSSFRNLEESIEILESLAIEKRQLKMTEKQPG